MSVKYSFIVPAYNVAPFLAKCIDSILVQTYNSFEIIIVDDGSPDLCGNIADKYQKDYPQIVKTIHQENTGQGGARNHGLDLARGEFVLFVDGDDFVSPNMLEILEKYTGKYNDDILFFEWESVDERDNVVAGGREYKDIHELMSLSEYVYQQPSPCRKLYKASMFKNRQLRFPEKIFYEDLALAPCFVQEVVSIGVIKEKLYYYVQRKGSTMHSKNIGKILDIIPAFDYIISFFKENGIFDEYYFELEWLAIQHVLYSSTARVLYVEYDKEAIGILIAYMKNTFPKYKNNQFIGSENHYINYDELSVLLNGDLDKFDAMFYRKRRIMQRVKSHIKRWMGC